uniref:BATXCTL20 n=1 Tax=Bothrops atrox TaxID=8725 RepID=A0A1L8D654_BOTAT
MGRFIFVSFGLLVVFLSLSGTAADCPPDWSSYEGSCYKVFKEKMTWADAERFCTLQQRHSHLVSFHSSEEVDFVMTLTFPILKYDFVWIGLSNVWNLCDRRWSDDADLDYKPWSEEPECVVSKSTDNQWLSFPCTRLQYFVCEFET